MYNNRAVRYTRNATFACATLMNAQAALANDNAEAFMTSETVMREMPAGDRFLYVTGILEGLAYARLVRDTEARGERDNSGMNCIYRWFYESDGQTFQLIQAAFDRFPDHFPNTIIAVLISRECGE
ncbi:MAG: hypothetical protein AAF234_11625 [Pseudomonadota bacterium]